MKKFDNLLDHMKNTDEAPSAESLARRAVATQLRALAHALGRSCASALQMSAVAEQLRTQSEVLRSENASPQAAHAGSRSVVPGMEDFHDRSPITGRANPMAPPVSLAPDPDAGLVTGEVTFGLAFEGAPGCVHGGFVAAVLDEALGMASAFSGAPGMTAELTTRYRQHTPILTSLRIEARLVSVEGRKIRASGEIYHGDSVTAEGSGLFIAVDADKFGKLLADRSQRTLD